MLCGGKSARMGRDKAMLAFGPELMLQRVVRLVGQVEQMVRIVVVAGKTQPLPKLPPEVTVVRDDDDYLGPLAGLAIGLRAVVGETDAVYATSCDAPLFLPGFAGRLFELLGDNSMGECDAVVPRDADGVHPLAAAYRVSVLDRIESLLATGERRLRTALEAIQVRMLDVELLRQVDPLLATLQNVNTPESYAAALKAARVAAPSLRELPPARREGHAG